MLAEIIAEFKIFFFLLGTNPISLCLVKTMLKQFI